MVLSWCDCFALACEGCHSCQLWHGCSIGILWVIVVLQLLVCGGGFLDVALGQIQLVMLCVVACCFLIAHSWLLDVTRGQIQVMLCAVLVLYFPFALIAKFKAFTIRLF